MIRKLFSRLYSLSEVQSTPIVFNSSRIVNFSALTNYLLHDGPSAVNIFNNEFPLVIVNTTNKPKYLEATVSNAVGFSSSDIGLGVSLDSKWDLGPVITVTGGATYSQEVSGNSPCFFAECLATNSTYNHPTSWQVYATLPAGASITIGHYSASRHLKLNSLASSINGSRVLTKFYRLIQF